MNKICRVCLEEGVLSSLFTRNYNLSIGDMLEYCFGAKIVRDDGLPDQLCSNCVYKLGITYHFKQTYESAEIRLKQYLGLRIESKTNDACVMTDPTPVQTQTLIRPCKCQQSVLNKKSITNYKRKAENEKLKRGPKPKPRKAHVCFQCDKEFRCEAQLDTHVRTHTGDRPFGCMYCSRRFSQKHNLTIHMRVHTGEKPFQCEVCSKRFSAQGNLQTHLKMHNGQKDHSCTLCGKSFVTSSELTRHVRKHRGVREYKCDVPLCSAAFMQARDLRLHKLKKHQIDVRQKPENKTDITNTHIDIIGIDVGSDAPIQNSEKLITPSLEHPERSKHEQKKDIYNPYLSFEKHNCSICGEQFDFITALAQHCLHHHKGYI